MDSEAHNATLFNFISYMNKPTLRVKRLEVWMSSSVSTCVYSMFHVATFRICLTMLCSIWLPPQMQDSTLVGDGPVLNAGNIGCSAKFCEFGQHKDRTLRQFWTYFRQHRDRDRVDSIGKIPVSKKSHS